MGRLFDMLGKSPQYDDGSLAKRLQNSFGLQPNQERGNILPIPDEQGKWTAPQWLYDTAKAFALPAHVAQGGNYNLNDVTDMAMNVGMLAAPVGAATMPKGAVGMGSSKIASKDVFDLVDKIYNLKPENAKEYIDEINLIMPNITQYGQKASLNRSLDKANEMINSPDFLAKKERQIANDLRINQDIDLANNSIFNQQKKPLILGDDIYREPKNYKQIIEKQLKKIGAEKEYQSNKKSSKGKSTSSYWDVNGKTLRISDHYVPETAQRLDEYGVYNPYWSGEIVLKDNTMRELDALKSEKEIIDYIYKILNGEE